MSILKHFVSINIFEFAFEPTVTSISHLSNTINFFIYLFSHVRLPSDKRRPLTSQTINLNLEWKTKSNESTISIEN